MHIYKENLISSFGNCEKIQSKSYRPEPYDFIEDIYNYQTGLRPLARGFGKSYSNCALSDHVIITNRLDHFISFDKQLGIITVQAGISIAEILQTIVPYGWLLPVLPGTKYVSIGGCIANNIHGKNHYMVGDFSSSIVSFNLRLIDNEMVECSRKLNSEIFFATIAGLGMTGFIEQVTLKLKPISSTQLRVKSKVSANLYDMILQFKENIVSAEYMVGWIDHFATGKSLGRGVFESACHIKDNDLKYETTEPFSINFYLPKFILNQYLIRFFNSVKFNASRSSTLNKSFNFFFPLDQIKNWEKIYGKRGLIQYQFVLPDNSLIIENITKIFEFLQKQQAYSNLVVIKYHQNSEGYMSFPINGFGIALDFHFDDKIIKLFDRMDEMICQMQGRVYLAKNIRLNKLHFDKMYGENLILWKQILKKLDPKNQLRSAMSISLGFKDYAD